MRVVQGSRSPWETKVESQLPVGVVLLRQALTEGATLQGSPRLGVRAVPRALGAYTLRLLVLGSLAGGFTLRGVQPLG